MDDIISCLIGKSLAHVRLMTDREMEEMGWDADVQGRPTVLLFQGGTRLYAAQDPEGSGPGVLFGVDAGWTRFQLNAPAVPSSRKAPVLAG